MLGCDIVLDFTFKDDILYLLQFLEDYIEDLVTRVLCDSEDDPHWSAVTAENLILCYIDVMKQLNKTLSYDDVKGYFKAYCFTDPEYELFKRKYQEELKCYVGKIRKKTD